MRKFALLGGFAILAGIAVGTAGLRAYNAPGPLAQVADIVIPRGGTLEVGAVLQQAGVVRSATAFRMAATLTAAEGPLRAAEFLFPAGASLQSVLRMLRAGRPVLHRITIAEGLTAGEVAALLTAADWLTGETIVPPEGSVLPQTYEFERGTTRRAVIARGEAAMHAVLTAAWSSRSEGVPLQSARQALVLASLVERETAVPAERPMVAAVFLNRLRDGMRLQSDPTVLYGVAGGVGALRRPLDRDDLKREGPYNTYGRTGLPSSPICNPGIASIQAALHPAPTAALYFVADGNGAHRFAVSLDEHNRNVAHAREQSGR